MNVFAFSPLVAAFITKLMLQRNLRGALIVAGMQLLEEGGLEALTLRKCAILAGVSSAAPSHHFDGIKGLRTAIAARGYKVFDEMTKTGIAAAAPDPHSQALGMSLGYIKFATLHNALFNLMIDSPDKFSEDYDWQDATKASNSILSDVSAHFVPGKGGAVATEFLLFALAHGYAKLIEIGRIKPDSGGALNVSYEDLFAMINLKVKPTGQSDQSRKI